MSDQIPLFPDLETPEIKLYRPSNGTEGDNFMSGFCYRCIHDFDACDIVLLTMAYDTKDPEYPREWRYVNGKPTCTKFIEKMGEA